MRKGFTLIELLAVIVILAIIALIATPIILGIINDAKEDSNKRSVENYAHAVELAVARYAASHDGVIPTGEFIIKDEGKSIEQAPIKIPVDYKGEKVEGKVNVLSEEGKEGRIELSEISFDEGKTQYNYSEENGVTKIESGGSGNNAVSSPFKVTKDGMLLFYQRQDDETSVVVPAEVNGVQIKKIADIAFLPGDIIIFLSEQLIVGLTEKAKEQKDLVYQNELVKDFEFVMIDEIVKGNVSVTIPDELSSEHMYAMAFIDSSVEGNLVFSGSDKSHYYLENIDLSNLIYLETIMERTFSGYQKDKCSSFDEYCGEGILKSVKFPMNGNLKTIGDYAFAFNQLSSLELPETLIEIRSNAFTDSDNQLKEVVIPSNVIKIGYGAFNRNPNLSTITVKRANSEGMDLGYNWSGSAQVVYDPN